jgi:iron complex transport system permease protein
MKRTVLTIVGLLGALLLSIGASVAIGSAHIGISETYRAVLVGITGSPHVLPPVIYDIVWELRMPRIILAAIVGGGLSIIGVAMQTLVHNPLAEPYILGVSSGASAGASLFYLGFLPPVISRTLTMPVAAFLGALLAITLVYVIARKGPVLSTARLLLAGVALSALLAAITTFVTFASPEPQKMRAVLFWLLGSFSGTHWSTVVPPALVTFPGLLLLTAAARPMDAFLLGEGSARSLGISVEALKRVLIVLAALVTGVLVAASGVIGFVGLIIPHAVRLVSGVSHRRLIPFSFLVGAIFMIWADLAARTVLPAQELPVGVLTAICGVPFFLILLRRDTYSFS